MRKPRAFLLVLLLALAGLPLAGCETTPELSPMQKRQITARVLDGGYENVFRATMTVIQDNGYIIKNADLATGLITAEVNREEAHLSVAMQNLLFGKVDNRGTIVEISAVLNKLNDQASEVRLNIQQKTYNASGNSVDVDTIYDQKVFDGLFNDFQIEIKRREALGSK